MTGVYDPPQATLSVLIAISASYAALDLAGPVTTASGRTRLTCSDLLAVNRVDQRSWQVKTASAPIKMLPFIDIADEQYTTYLQLA